MSEEERARLEHCVATIDERVGPLPEHVRLYPRAGRCEDELLPALRAADAFGQPMLVNLDPFSAGIPYDVVCEAASNPRPMC